MTITAGMRTGKDYDRQDGWEGSGQEDSGEEAGAWRCHNMYLMITVVCQSECLSPSRATKLVADGE